MPIVAMIAGPNGAGKTTAASHLLRGPVRVDAFVNADIIAQGLGGGDSDQTAVAAGRIMLQRLDELAEADADFAFETTLASRTFAPRIAALKRRGYLFCLFYLWLPTADDSIRRVGDRVRRGGHFVPDDTIRRRRLGGMRNFFRLYRPLADIWQFYENSSKEGPRMIASGVRQVERIADKALWARILQEVHDDPAQPN